MTPNVESLTPFRRPRLVAAILAPIIAALLLSSGCAHPERVHPDEPRADLPPVSRAAYDGPRLTIAVRPLEPGRVIDVQMTVPTGGHRLALDYGNVIDGEAHVFLTLTRPAPDEVVTMALETKRETFETDRNFDNVRVYVRTHRRGEARPAEYRLAGESAWGSSR